MLFLALCVFTLCYRRVWAGLASTAQMSTDCQNTNYSRNCWGSYNILSNYYEEASHHVPDTGVIREYWFEITNGTGAPDGVSRPILAVNGTVPGPTILANWGDTVVVHVHNAMQSNGSTIHFHGVRQNFTNPMDGVPSITQCPIGPGESYTYRWRATQYGTSWYHSHWALQAWEGVFGGIVIQGPATQNYDWDKGVIFLNDWTHQTVDELWYYAEEHGTFTMDNGLINGTNVYHSVGQRLDIEFVSGNTYRLRLINAALDTHFKFSIDQHNLTVIAMDFVAIEPVIVPYISIGMGQRYDVLVTANQPSQSYWLRAIPQNTCSDNDNSNNIKAIVHYVGSPIADPTTQAFPMPDDCNDEPMASLVPALSLSPNSSTLSTQKSASVSLSMENNYFRWEIGPQPMQVAWADPSLLQIYNNATHWNTSDNVIELSVANEWVFLVIQNTNNVAHPIHLHGHDFYLLAQDIGTYSSSSLISTNNPPRRDVAMFPGGGFMVIAFLTDNPGAWLLHCHIGLHSAMGFALQFIERQEEARSLIDYNTLSGTCDSWTSSTATDDIEEDDSGI